MSFIMMFCCYNSGDKLAAQEVKQYLVDAERRPSLHKILLRVRDRLIPIETLTIRKRNFLIDIHNRTMSYAVRF